MGRSGIGRARDGCTDPSSMCSALCLGTLGPAPGSPATPGAVVRARLIDVSVRSHERGKGKKLTLRDMCSDTGLIHVPSAFRLDVQHHRVVNLKRLLCRGLSDVLARVIQHLLDFS